MMMYRLYVPAIDLEITHEKIEVLYSILAEIQAGRYILQEMGWVDANPSPPSPETPTPL